MKIRPQGIELFHADGETDGRTDMMKPTVAFRNIANAPINKRRFHRTHIPHIFIAFNGCQTRLRDIYIFVKTLKPIFVYVKFSYGVVKVYLLWNLRVLLQLSKNGQDMRVLL